MPNFDCWPEGRRRLAGVGALLSMAVVLLLAGCSSSPGTTDAPSFQRKYGDFAYCPVPVTEQSTPYTCGPACLSSVMTYWDVETSEAWILDTYPTQETRPYYLVELQSIAEVTGLKAYVISMDTAPRDETEQQILKGRPLICAVRLPMTPYLLSDVPILGPVVASLAWALPPRKDHFVVVVGLKPDDVLIMDPAHGFATLPWRRFERAWSRMKHACLLVSD